MEKISIKNFAGIKEMDFEFKSINILIGPQGSGKSVTVKLHYFFRSFFQELKKNLLTQGQEKELNTRPKEKFIRYFPKDTWPEGDFKIAYTYNDFQIVVENLENQLHFYFSENLRDTIFNIKMKFESEREAYGNDPVMSSYPLADILIQEHIGASTIHKQIFIPAGRSFFAHVQNNIFLLLSANATLDPFLVEFGVYYETLKRSYSYDWGENFVRHKEEGVDELVAEVLNANYVNEDDQDYLIHKDKRKVNLSNASSGQQETLPLMLILESLSRSVFSNGGAAIYIEEPEAHLFPNAQKAIVQLLGRIFNNKYDNSFQIFLTTHSPYVLSSFNNLLEAGRLIELKPEKYNDIAKIVPVGEQLKPGLLSAYSINNGSKDNLIDPQTNLINQTVLDTISSDIAMEFGKLLDIEF
jgi:predicted ATP-binding protein involved in virulence